MDKKTHFVDAQNAVWAELWESLGGVYLNRGGWRQDKLRVTHGDWTVTLDFHSHAGYGNEALYTRFRALFTNHEGFRFRVLHQGWLESVEKLLGVQDVELGDPEFDQMFLVQANDEARIRKLLDDDVLRSFLREEPHVFVGLTKVPRHDAEEAGPDDDEVLMELRGKVEDEDRMKRLWMTFARLLAGLCEDAAGYHPPRAT